MASSNMFSKAGTWCSNLFSDFKTVMYKNYGENPGSLLVHTGVLGWILSSLAQVSAVVFNDKIKPEEKMFLIPQEFADAAVNILSFYLITNSFKNTVSKLVSSGKWRTSKLSAFIQKIGLPKSEIGKITTDLRTYVKADKDVENHYKLFKNGMEVMAGVVGSTISCNIVTPVLRNQYASKKQKEMVAKMKQKQTVQTLQSPKGLSMDDYQKNCYTKYSGSLKI